MTAAAVVMLDMVVICCCCVVMTGVNRVVIEVTEAVVVGAMVSFNVVAGGVVVDANGHVSMFERHEESVKPHLCTKMVLRCTLRIPKT